jgi:hypothetical protein
MNIYSVGYRTDRNTPWTWYAVRGTDIHEVLDWSRAHVVPNGSLCIVELKKAE